MPRETSGLTVTEFTTGVDDDLDLRRIDAELLRRDLLGDGMDPLAHLGPAVPHLDLAVRTEVDHCPGNFLESVAEAAVLQSETHTDRLAGGAGGVVMRLDGIEGFARTTAPVIHDLAGTPTRRPVR